MKNGRMLRGRSILAAGLLVVACAGCGGSGGSGRVEVYGTVSHGGKPIPAGEVVFEPDPTQGNTGPQARATIENGRYRTPRGQGSVPGAVVVRVEAYDGQPHPESPYGLQLFPAYTTTLVLPDRSSEQDIDVPATHAAGG